ncbi:hypothetical protein H920_04291 [Fukomys damarensis]|uniref:Uncharacterized protein n=1 Tax=Fukomys damarensis TaxID=885580 RepID=A0A091DV11_FUKDA|nr:hypothetical protein H920_04291 [Fukomys damarensis]
MLSVGNFTQEEDQYRTEKSCGLNAGTWVTPEYKTDAPLAAAIMPPQCCVQPLPSEASDSGSHHKSLANPAHLQPQEEGPFTLDLVPGSTCFQKAAQAEIRSQLRLQGSGDAVMPHSRTTPAGDILGGTKSSSAEFLIVLGFLLPIESAAVTFVSPRIKDTAVAQTGGSHPLLPQQAGDALLDAQGPEGLIDSCVLV